MLAQTERETTYRGKLVGIFSGKPMEETPRNGIWSDPVGLVILSLASAHSTSAAFTQMWKITKTENKMQIDTEYE